MHRACPLRNGDLKNRNVPTVVKGLEGVKVISGSCGKNHTVVITDTAGPSSVELLGGIVWCSA